MWVQPSLQLCLESEQPVADIRSTERFPMCLPLGRVFRRVLLWVTLPNAVFATPMACLTQAIDPWSRSDYMPVNSEGQVANRATCVIARRIWVQACRGGRRSQ
jgi:hypothetical protein